MKLCMDCKHYGGVAPQHGRYVCNHPNNKFTHPVDGMEWKYDAEKLRTLSGAILCGMEARWWAPKPPSTPGAAPPRGP